MPAPHTTHTTTAARARSGSRCRPPAATRRLGRFADEPHQPLREQPRARVVAPTVDHLDGGPTPALDVARWFHERSGGEDLECGRRPDPSAHSASLAPSPFRHHRPGRHVGAWAPRYASSCASSTDRGRQPWARGRRHRRGRRRPRIRRPGPAPSPRGATRWRCPPPAAGEPRRPPSGDSVPARARRRRRRHAHGVRGGEEDRPGLPAGPSRTTVVPGARPGAATPAPGAVPAPGGSAGSGGSAGGGDGEGRGHPRRGEAAPRRSAGTGPAQRHAAQRAISSTDGGGPQPRYGRDRPQHHPRGRRHVVLHHPSAHAPVRPARCGPESLRAPVGRERREPCSRRSCAARPRRGARLRRARSAAPPCRESGRGALRPECRCCRRRWRNCRMRSLSLQTALYRGRPAALRL